MRRKKLPQSKHKGMSIYCSKCRAYFTWTSKTIINDDGKTQKREPLCGLTKRTYSSCKFPDKQRFRVRVYVAGKQTPVSKTLDAQRYDDAVIEAIEFRNSIKEYATEGLKENQGLSKRIYLIDAQAKFIDFLNNIDVPLHKHIERSREYIEKTALSFRNFNDVLLKRGVQIELMLLNNINDTHVGYFHSYLLEVLNHKPTTYNTKMGILNGFFKWTLENYEEVIKKNPFAGFKSLEHLTDNLTITKGEFDDLLTVITKERGVYFAGKKGQYKRNAYKPYLKNAFKLLLHTGSRREEAVIMKWNMIHFVEDTPMYLEVPNLKVKRKKGKGFDANVAPKIIPITEELWEILKDMGAADKIGQDQYIIPRKAKAKYETIANQLTLSFTHYYRLLNTGRDISLKHLRKTYLSYLKLAMGDDTKSMSSHATDEVLNNHYIDFRIIAKATREFSIFNLSEKTSERPRDN